MEPRVLYLEGWIEDQVRAGKRFEYRDPSPPLPEARQGISRKFETSFLAARRAAEKEAT